MTEQEHLLSILAEEAVEVAQRATKALRFGLAEIEPGQTLDNAERIRKELADFLGVYEMLYLAWPQFEDVIAKKTKVRRFLEYSKQCGTLNETTGSQSGSTERKIVACQA